MPALVLNGCCGDAWPPATGHPPRLPRQGPLSSQLVVTEVTVPGLSPATVGPGGLRNHLEKTEANLIPVLAKIILGGQERFLRLVSTAAFQPRTLKWHAI